LADPPADVTVTVPSVGIACSESFQPIRRASASIPAGDCMTSVNVPRQAMPVDTLLYPCAWAPTTARSTPPARPSNTWPWMSTRKLYPMSFQRLPSRWKRAMPSTIAAESSGPYLFVVTVWCTNAIWTSP
jgi:hypothetical protein